MGPMGGQWGQQWSGSGDGVGYGVGYGVRSGGGEGRGGDPKATPDPNSGVFRVKKQWVLGRCSAVDGI